MVDQDQSQQGGGDAEESKDTVEQADGTNTSENGGGDQDAAGDEEDGA